MTSIGYLRNNGWSAPQRFHSKKNPVRQLAVRVGAVLALVFIGVLAVSELAALRGELAFVRFLQYQRLARVCTSSESLKKVVQEALAEVELISDFAKGNPDALTEASAACVEWAGKKELDPLLCLQLAHAAVQAAVLAVDAAPSDFERWQWLAYALSVLNLKKYSDICMKRAQELAPPGVKLKLER